MSNSSARILSSNLRLQSRKLQLVRVVPHSMARCQAYRSGDSRTGLRLGLLSSSNAFKSPESSVVDLLLSSSGVIPHAAFAPVEYWLLLLTSGFEPADCPEFTEATDCTELRRLFSGVWPPKDFNHIFPSAPLPLSLRGLRWRSEERRVGKECPV